MSFHAAPATASKFGRYAVASAAALGATAAQAQFTGDYSLTSPSPAGDSYANFTNGATFGAWTVFQTGSGQNSIYTGSEETGYMNLNVSAGFGSQTIDFILTNAVTQDTQVSFHWGSSNFSNGGAVNVSFSDNYGALSFTALNTANGYLNGDATFLVTANHQFGFRVSAAYGNTIQSTAGLGIYSFSAVAAVPEPASAGLLMGCAGLGFIALMGTREMRRRAAAKSAV